MTAYMNEAGKQLSTLHVVSADGTNIAFDRLGAGPPVILVSGILCDRNATQALAEHLAQQFSVLNYDRRGRGASSDTAPYAVEREVEDLGALIAAAGGSVMLYGHSSGAGLAIHAAAAGLPISRLVLHEPPYNPGPNDDESTHSARELAESVRLSLIQNRRADAIKAFLGAAGLPPEMLEEQSNDASMLALAPTMVYDHEIMGDFDRGGTIPQELVRAITTPTLVIAGGASPEFFRATAAQIAQLLPDAQYKVLQGQDHGAPADVVAPVLAEFFTEEKS